MSKLEEQPQGYRESHKNLYQLVLLNDDEHTFDYVMECLIDILNYDPIQAEQCATITHFKQKCVLRTGELEQVQLLENKLKNKGLALEIVK